MKSSKMFKSIASFALVAAMVAPTLVTSPVSVDAAKKMSLSAKSALLPVGSTASVSVKNAAKKSTFSWKSSSTKVATVSGKTKKATVTAKAAGTAKISCTVKKGKKKGKKKTVVSGFTVKVRQKVTSFAMQDSSSKACTSDTIKIGETLVLKGAINNNASGSTSNQTVKWSSSNSKIAKVQKKSINTAKVTGISEGTATISATVAYKSTVDKKTASCTIKVSGTAVATATSNNKGPQETAKADNTKATPTPWTYAEGTLYKQHYNVTRWYNPDTTGAINGHTHDGYKNNNFAIWMVGFYDNEYSTNEKDINKFGGPAINSWTDASKKDAKEQDFRGTALRLSGDFSYDGPDQKTILLQVNYTSPVDYPILWKWEKNASKQANEYASGLKIKGVNGSENLNHGDTGKVDVTFTVPSNATNGDKDPDTGKNYGIYLYFPNKPGGALAYVKDNTFHFKNFWLRKA